LVFGRIKKSAIRLGGAKPNRQALKVSVSLKLRITYFFIDVKIFKTYVVQKCNGVLNLIYQTSLLSLFCKFVWQSLFPLERFP